MTFCFLTPNVCVHPIPSGATQLKYAQCAQTKDSWETHTNLPFLGGGGAWEEFSSQVWLYFHDFSVIIRSLHIFFWIYQYGRVVDNFWYSWVLTFLWEKKKTGLKDVQAIILRNCEYVNLHGKKYFVDVIKVTDLEIERLSWIIWVGQI